MLILRSLASCFLLTVLMLPTMAPVILNIQQAYIKWQMMESLEVENLITIQVKTSELRWERKNKECRIHNRLFDVRTIQTRQGISHLTGLFDDQEKAIEERLNDLGGKQNEKTGSIVHKIINLNLIGPHQEELSKQTQPSPVLLFLPLTDEQYNEPDFPIQTPPPEIA